jgi:hypothetical protein
MANQLVLRRCSCQIAVPADPRAYWLDYTRMQGEIAMELYRIPRVLLIALKIVRITGNIGRRIY